MVEELCTLKRELIAVGVPADRVGLRHGYEFPNDASEPSEGHDRQVLLVTHNRIMNSAADTFHL